MQSVSQNLPWGAVELLGTFVTPHLFLIFFSCLIPTKIYVGQSSLSKTPTVVFGLTRGSQSCIDTLVPEGAKSILKYLRNVRKEIL